MRNRLIAPIFALVLILSTMLFAIPIYASGGPVDETLSVDEVWLTGDILHIAVADINSGSNQTLELNLREYAKSGDEYVTVQAITEDGGTSNAIQFKNPYYSPQADCSICDP